MQPRDDADALEWLIFEQAGVLTSAQAEAAIGRGRLRGRIRSGRWRALCRGLILAGNGRLDRQQQLWAAVLAAGRTAVLAGPTALAESGVRGVRSETLHVLLPEGRMASPVLRGLPIDMPAVRAHRTTVLPEAHRQVGRPMRTTIARAAVDAVAWARSEDEGRLMLVAACQQRRVTPEEIREALAVLPRQRRRALITRTVADIEGGAEALSELDFVALCRRHRLPPPTLQERRRDAAGRQRYLDAYWREWRLHVEIDGAQHMDARQWEADMRRQNDVWISGDRILRFPAAVVRSRPAEVARQVRAALEAAGWRRS